MKEFSYTITDPAGMHARPAGEIVAAAKKHTCFATMWVGENSYDMKKLLVLMGSKVQQGTTVVVRTEGFDEDAASADLEAAFKANL